MATYVLLLTLYPEGRERVAADPEVLARAEVAAATPGVRCLGLYGVLGKYDFVAIAEAPDNEAIARFSLNFGVRAGAHIETLPAVPVGLLSEREAQPAAGSETFETEPVL
ncbi:MAG: GYD domain-containing protein [Dehalococcoidia bacterium]|nr:GYD domain-containing protein [Dehalococcoidia bacterium]